MRNYKRYLGTLLETHWILDEIEVGVSDRIYDPVKAKHFFEKKIVKMKVNAIIDVQWIKERIEEEEFVARLAEESGLADEEEDKLPV